MHEMYAITHFRILHFTIFFLQNYKTKIHETIILLIVLYGCEGKQELRTLMNTTLRRNLDGIKQGTKKLHDKL
jgi:hypothetical protein